MEKELSLREEASLVIGFRLPEDPMQWEPMIKDLSVSGIVDNNKKFNLTIMLLMRLNEVEKKLQELINKDK
jgi:hypothetical protein